MRFSIEKFLKDHSIPFDLNGTESHFILHECPFCHGKNKFYIDRREGRKRYGKFVCHKCAARPGSDTKGNIVKLVSLLGNYSLRQAFTLVYRGEMTEEERGKLFTVNQLSFLHQKPDDYDDDVEPIKVPPFLRKITPEDQEAWSYLKDKRGLSEKDISMMDVLITESMDYKTIFAKAKEFCDGNEDQAKFWTALRGRVCMPVRKNGRTFGLVCRDYTGKASMKVLNTKGNFRNALVWNLDRAKDSKVVVIAEGIISAAKCGMHRSVATLGKFITTAQFSELFKLSPDTKMVVVSDPDEEEVAEKNAHLLQGYFNDVYLLKLPHVLAANGKDFLDAGDYSFEENDKRIQELINSDQASIKAASAEISFSPRKIRPPK